MNEHAKFICALNTRIHCLNPVMHQWNSGNVKSAVKAIQK